VIISPLRDYIQEWLNNSIAKIYEIPKKVVTIGNQTSKRKGTKEISTRK
jgi:hypothetical protein